MEVCELTLSLLSFLLTMRAVMCWSTKNRIVANRAGMMAAGGAQDGRPLPAHEETSSRSLKQHTVAATLY